MNYRNIYLLALVMFLLNACATNYHVISDYESGIDFSSYNSFQIATQPNGFPLGANPINKQRIERAIVNEMEAIGFYPSTNPDLIINWFVKVEDVSEGLNYLNYDDRWRNPFHVYVADYKKGTLVINIADRRKKLVVWHGKTSETVYEDMPKIEEKINNAVKSILKKFANDAELGKLYVSNS